MQLAGGLGLFLFGMKLMGDGLEMAAGSKLRGNDRALDQEQVYGRSGRLSGYRCDSKLFGNDSNGSWLCKRG